MKIKLLITLLLMTPIVSVATLANDDLVDKTSEETEYTEVSPLIFDFWW